MQVFIGIFVENKKTCRGYDFRYKDNELNLL